MAKQFHQGVNADVCAGEFGSVGVPQPLYECAWHWLRVGPGTIRSHASKRRAKCALQGEACDGYGGEDDVEVNEMPALEPQRVPFRSNWRSRGCFTKGQSSQWDSMRPSVMARV